MKVKKDIHLCVPDEKKVQEAIQKNKLLTGRRLKEIREIIGLTLEKAADYTHTEESAIGKYERNQMSPSNEVLARMVTYYHLYIVQNRINIENEALMTWIKLLGPLPKNDDKKP